MLSWSNQPPSMLLVTVQQRHINMQDKPRMMQQKQKRIRTDFSTDQLLKLENTFSSQQYIDKYTRSKLANILNVNSKCIKTWFQNRRMKSKKQISETSVDSTSEESNTLICNQTVPKVLYSPLLTPQSQCDAGYSSQYSPSTSESYSKPEKCNRTSSIEKNITRTVKKMRNRIRTAFSAEQIWKLEETFSSYRYIQEPARTELANSLNTDTKCIKIWFQNRRMKEKKQFSKPSCDSTIEESNPRVSNQTAATTPSLKIQSQNLDVGYSSQYSHSADESCVIPVPCISAPLEESKLETNYSRENDNYNDVATINQHAKYDYGYMHSRDILSGIHRNNSSYYSTNYYTDDMNYSTNSNVVDKRETQLVEKDNFESNQTIYYTFN